MREPISDLLSLVRELSVEYFRDCVKICACSEPVRHPDLSLNKETGQYFALGQICCHKAPIDYISDQIAFSLEREMTQAEIDCATYILDILVSRLRNHGNLAGRKRIISIGETCLPRTLPTKWGLKPSKAMGEISMPFDLAIHPLSAVSDILSGDFSDYLSNEEIRYDYDLEYVVNSPRGIHWNHECGGEWIEPNLDRFKRLYTRRIMNFRFASRGSVLFFACVDRAADKAIIEKLCASLATHYSGEGAVAILSSDDGEPIGVTSSSDYALPVSLLNLPLPKNDYKWWFYEDFITQGGLKWERTIVEWLLSLTENENPNSVQSNEHQRENVMDEDPEMELERAIETFVLSNRQHEPEATLKALMPIADFHHVQRPWVWKSIADAALAISNTDLFLEFARRFILSSDTQREDYRVGKLGLIFDCVRELIIRNRPIEEEMREFHALSPSQHEIDRLASLGIEIGINQQSTFDDDGPKLLVPACEAFAAPDGFSVAPHFGAHPRQPTQMTIRQVIDVDYVASGADTALIRSDGSVYRQLSRSPAILQTWRLARDKGQMRDCGGTAVAMNDIFTLANYCHWLLDWLPRLLAAQEEVGAIDYVCTRHARNSFELETLHVVAGIRPEQVIVDQQQVLHFERVIIVDNHRIAETHPIWGGNRKVIELLRRRVFAKLDGRVAERQKRRVYLSRQDAGSRVVINEDDLRVLLERHEVQVVSIGSMTVLEQARLFSECELVIGVHGAGLANIVYMPRGGNVIELFHYQFGSGAYSTLAQGCGHRYSFLSCDSTPGSSLPIERPSPHKVVRYQYSDIWVEPSQLEDALMTCL